MSFMQFGGICLVTSRSLDQFPNSTSNLGISLRNKCITINIVLILYKNFKEEIANMFLHKNCSYVGIYPVIFLNTYL